MSDLRLDKTAGPILASPNRLKLAVFGINDDRGLVMTMADGPPRATWEEGRRLVLESERLGFDAVIPIARWLGYGGKTNPGARSFEAFTWAAGAAAITERIQIFATFHVPTVHPVMGAKMAATVDHISGGRFGLNIVAGWQPEEIAMFGTPWREHDERYEVSDEWATLIKRLWTEDGEFDFHGRFFEAPGCFSEPKPLQAPYPLVMSAGVSPAGRRFAAKHADMVFAAIADPDQTAQTVAELKQFARDEYDKDLLVFARGHVTCRETAAEARAAYEHFIIAHGDREAGENVLRTVMKHSQSIDFSSAETQAMVEAVIRGYFAHPMTGTPEQLADRMSDLADTDLDGIAISWNDYDEGLEQYERLLLPLLVARGLRQPLG